MTMSFPNNIEFGDFSGSAGLIPLLTWLLMSGGKMRTANKIKRVESVFMGLSFEISHFPSCSVVRTSCAFVVNFFNHKGHEGFHKGHKGKT